MQLEEFTCKATRIVDEAIAICSPSQLDSDNRETSTTDDGQAPSSPSGLTSMPSTGWEELERQKTFLSNIERAIIRKRRQKRQNIAEKKAGNAKDDKLDEPTVDKSFYIAEQVVFVMIAIAVWAGAVYGCLYSVHFPFHRHLTEVRLGVALPGLLFAAIVCNDTQRFLHQCDVDEAEDAEEKAANPTDLK
jgi:hypothetical protein